ncbi:S41 family peptidase [Hyalangium minutum]|uniref:Interphotoreceptor retinoid-binding protein n=1 Tax=Hyalangium minutum TaxID=394096 RepID=A0A085W3X7_9BACT|nr:S41 family peptidase [Hyalangium minutum]KFE62390.1 interphotoreceptor retinoid-binding protein [Hyalangium minutum]
MRAKIVDRVSAALNENYVFPDVAKKMEAGLRQKLKAGAYDKIANSAELAEVLTRDLREVSKDKHLSVRYAPSKPPDLDEDAAKDPAVREKIRNELASVNFGFEKVERLAGNVGYLDLRGFIGAEFGGETAVATMNFLGNSDAVIIDLRKNGGGDPSMVQFITSYFFEESTHLNSFYIRKGNTTKQFWTSAHVAGKRMANVPVYVLTSSRTFSAAEEFTYNLKNLKRATIVGETTGGGAHPVNAHFLADVHLLAFIPFGRAVNPITGTNWEGTGIAPDIQVPADKALVTAHQDALKKLQNQAKDEARKQQLSWSLQKVEAQANPVTLTAEVLKSFAGSYGSRTLKYENGSLWYERQQTGLKVRAVPMTADTLMLDDGMDILRLRIEKDASGKVTGLTALYDDGHADKSPRTGG